MNEKDTINLSEQQESSRIELSSTDLSHPESLPNEQMKKSS